MCMILSNRTLIAAMISLFLIMPGCNAIKRIDNTLSLKDYFTNEKMIYKASDAINVPPDPALVKMADNAGKIMAEALDIMEKDDLFFMLTGDVNESQKSLAEWLKKTQSSQKKLAMLLKNNPEIYCLSLKLINHKIDERRMRIPKNFKQFNMMWLYDPEKDSCFVVAFPQDSLVSFYGAGTGDETDKRLIVYVENIPEYFIWKVVSGRYPYFVDEGVEKELNKLTLLEQIIDGHDLISLDGEGSKGSLISFTKNLEHKGRGFAADGIRAYSLYRNSKSTDLILKPSCPTTIYGKTYCICSEFYFP